MKTTRIVLLALALSGALAGASSASTSISAGIHIGPSGHARVDLGFFYDDLAPYGHWVERPHYGWVWTPRIVRADWRPYEYGHWVWTDYGWTWVSDEPFGWATYHYGRWYDDPDYGWEWVPGDEWAPSYVSWQEGDNYVGWAALPPSVDIRAGRFDVSIAPYDYVFVPETRFLDTRPYAYAVPRPECDRIYRQTRNWTNYRYANNQVFNVGVPVDRVQRVIGRPVPRYQVADLGWNQRHQARLQANRVAMFRPQVERAARVAPPPARPIARRSVMSPAQLQAQVQRNHQNQGRWARQQQQQAAQQQARQGRQARQQQAQQGRQLRQQARQQQAQLQQARQGRQARQQQAQQGRQFRQQVRQQQAQQQQARQGRQARQQQAQQARQFRQQARQQQAQQQQARQGRQARQQQAQQARQFRQQARQQQAQQQQARQGRQARQQQAQQGRQFRQQQVAQQRQVARQGRPARQQQGNGGQGGGGGRHHQRPPNGQ